MEKQSSNSNKIISRLKYFKYNYRHDGNILKIHLPMSCFLKIKFKDDGIKLSSHIHFGFHFLPLEWNFLIYGLVFYVLAYFQWPTLNKGIFVLLGLFVTYFVVCFIKIETMKSIIHNWLEKDSK